MNSETIGGGAALSVVLGAGLLLIGGCTGQNPDYCDAQTPCKAKGTVCDLAKRQCVVVDGSVGEAGLPDGPGGEAGSPDIGSDLGIGDGPPISCGDDSACPQTAYCEKSIGRCLPQKENGVACARPRQCGSGLCSTAEQVCCDRTCDGACETCKGKPKCELRPKGESCGAAAVCNNTPTGSSISEELCDGSSAQCQKQSTSCGAYRCDAAGACLTSCTKHSECASKVCELWDAATKNSCVDATQVCYVDANGAPSGDGSLAKPYQKISECTAKGAAIIAVGSGKYVEDIAISKDTLLLGYDAGPTLHNAGGGVTATVVIQPVLDGVQFLTTAKKVRIVGVQIVGEGTGAVSHLLLSNDDTLELSLEMVLFRDSPNSAFMIGKCLSVEAIDITTRKNGQAGRFNCPATIRDMRVEENVVAGIEFTNATMDVRGLAARHNGGVGVRVQNAQFDLRDLVVSDSAGVGLRAHLKSVGALSNALIVHNGAAGIAIEENSTINAVHATVADNTSALDCNSSTAQSSFTNSIVWGTVSDSTKACVFSYSARPVYDSGKGNIDPADPGFTDPSALVQNYRLKSGAPCVDAGSSLVPGWTLPTTDLDGKPRPMKGTAGATTALPDMGAYERQAP